MDWKTLLLKNWKSTAIGVLGLAIAIVLAVMVLPPKAGAGVITLAVLRAAVGYLQTDAEAGKQ